VTAKEISGAVWLGENHESAKGFIMRHARGSIHFRRLSFGRRQAVAKFRKLRAQSRGFDGCNPIEAFQALVCR
jgi:hypothetical protein